MKPQPLLELFMLLLVLFLAVLFRVYGGLTDIPPAFFPGEANMALDAESILRGHIYLVTPPEGGEGAIYPSLMALTSGLFGSGTLQARMLTTVLSAISAGVALVFLRPWLAPPKKCGILPLIYEVLSG